MADDLQIDSKDDRNRRFVTLLGRHERRLNAYVLSLVPSWSDAEEIVQQTRIRLWEQFDEYEADKDFGAWARTIAYYQVLTYRKRSGRNARRLTNTALEMLAEKSERESDELAPRRVAMDECLQELDARQRALLARCYSGGESIKEVAESLGRTFGAVRQTIFRLRAVLYNCVQRKLTKEGR